MRIEAGIVPSASSTYSDPNWAADIDRVQKVLELKMVRDRMEKMGLTNTEVQARLDKLSDTQLHQLALKLDELNTGRIPQGS